MNSSSSACWQPRKSYLALIHLQKAGARIVRHRRGNEIRVQGHHRSFTWAEREILVEPLHRLVLLGLFVRGTQRNAGEPGAWAWADEGALEPLAQLFLLGHYASFLLLDGQQILEKNY